MKRNYCWAIATFTVICSVVFFVSMSLAGTESTETQGLRDALTDEITRVPIEMGVLRDLQNEMWRLKSSWDSCQRDLRELGLNKLGDVAQLDVTNTIVKMWAIIPQQTRRQIDYGRSLNSYMEEAIDMVHTQLFHTDSVVELYDTAWAELYGAVWTHNYGHSSPSETDHSTPKFVSNWKYRSNFPSFLCAGDCGNSFGSPYSPHDKVCGVNDNTSVAGCSKSYFTCVEEENNKHKVLTCGKWVWRRTNPPPGVLPARIRDHVCGVQFRNCTNRAVPHYWEWPTKHDKNGTQAEQEYAEQELEETAQNPSPEPSYHACNDHEEWQSGIHTAAACGLAGHFVCDNLDHSSSYTCNIPPCSNRVVPYCLALCPETSSHGTTPDPAPTPAPTPESTPTTVACGGNGWTGCTEQVSSENDHYVSSCSNCSNSYWTCRPVHGAVKHEPPRTCARNGCDNTFTLCSRPPCDVNSEWKCQ